MFDALAAMADPTNLAELRELLRKSDPEEHLRPIEMKDIYIQHNAVELLPSILHGLTTGKRILIVSDTTVIMRDRAELKGEIFDLLDSEFELERLVLSSPDGNEVHADDANSKKIQEMLPGIDVVVGVGSGTITDLCKEATYQTDGSIPLVIIQTALSVNAFSDGVSVMLKQGVKRTVQARYPTVLIIDLDIVLYAPHEMNLAGYGDLIATWTAPADWFLAHKTGMNPNFHSVAGDILRKQNYGLMLDSEKLRSNDPDALELLARVLTLSGLAMGIVGESSPASGTEHIIGHLLDMAGGCSGRKLCYHGAQVSIGGILTSIAWDILIKEFEPSAIDPEHCIPSEQVMKTMVYDAFSWLDDTGRAADECWNDYQKKLSKWRENKENFKEFLANWRSFKEKASAMLLSPDFICDSMNKAGAPTRFSRLAPPVDADTVKWALLNCHLMRNRFTLADLLFYTGMWNEAFIERILKTAERYDAGL